MEETAWPFFSRKSVEGGSSWNLDFVLMMSVGLSPGKSDLGEIRGQYEVFFLTSRSR